MSAAADDAVVPTGFQSYVEVVFIAQWYGGGTCIFLCPPHRKLETRDRNTFDMIYIYFFY